MFSGLRDSRLFRGSTRRRNSSNEMPGTIQPPVDEPPSENEPNNYDSNIESGYNAFRDAREIVKLFQCSECSKVLNAPVSTPCCRTPLCTTCLRNVAAQMDECSICHAPQDNWDRPVKDYKLEELTDAFCDAMMRSTHTDDTGLVRVGMDGTNEYPVQESGGRLAATFTLVQGGNVPFESELAYESESHQTDIIAADATNLKRVKDAIRPLLECIVCCEILLDPVTVTCGHTFCMSCLTRALDSNPSCPFCRVDTNVPSVSLPEFTNDRITEILLGLFPTELAERSAQADFEKSKGPGLDGMETPIFVCTPSLPYVPQYLRIFEPRYRLMLRRCLDSNRRFGMVWTNPYNYPGEEGRFQRVGTMLEITECRWDENGEAYIGTVGLYKFIINEVGIRDDYIVANVETFDDFSPADEAAFERSEMAYWGRFPNRIDAQPTNALMHILSAELARVFHVDPAFCQRILNSMGPPPSTPEAMSYYFWTVLGRNNDGHSNFRLLQERSARVRLKMVLCWYHQSPFGMIQTMTETGGYVSYVLLFVMCLVIVWLILK